MPPHIMCHFALFSVEAIVRVYKDIWATVVGEELLCQHEDGNRADPFAVSCAPSARIKILTSSKFRMEKIFIV